MKTCTKCTAGKPLADYYTHMTSRDGHMSECKECFKARMQALSENRRQILKQRASPQEDLCKS